MSCVTAPFFGASARKASVLSDNALQKISPSPVRSVSAVSGSLSSPRHRNFERTNSRASLRRCRLNRRRSSAASSLEALFVVFSSPTAPHSVDPLSSLTGGVGCGKPFMNHGFNPTRNRACRYCCRSNRCCILLSIISESTLATIAQARRHVEGT